MHILVTVLIGAILGWLAYSQFGLNRQRGTIVSVIVGAAGALLGVEMLAPAFGDAQPELFTASGLLFASVAAAAALLAANFVYERWGF